MEGAEALEIERLRYVTRRFVALQGLRRLVWIGPLLAWLALEVQSAPPAGWFWLFLLTLPAAALGSWWLRRWYTRTYGAVARDEDEWARIAYRGLAVFLGVMALIVVFNLRYPDTLAPLAPELGWAPFLVAAVVAAHGWTVRRVRTDRLVIAAVVAAVGLVPVGLVTGGVNPLNTFEGTLATCIATLAAVWVADHRFLSRCLSSRASAEAAS